MLSNDFERRKADQARKATARLTVGIVATEESPVPEDVDELDPFGLAAEEPALQSIKPTPH